jgi:uncharacterized protein (DUF58 family)
MQIFILMPLLMLAYYLYQLYFSSHWLRGLEAQLAFGKNVTEGDSTELTEVIINRKKMHIPFLEVRFQTARGLGITGGKNVSESDRVNVVDVFCPGRYERITRTIPVSCHRRGYYQILHTSLVSTDLIGTSQYYSETGQYTELYVYPKVLPPDRFDITFSQMLGDVVTRRFLNEDVFTFRGIRDYTWSDTISSVNWKASARTGSLKVNLHDPTSSQEVRILLNTEPPSVLYDNEILEDSIRTAMTLTSFFTANRIPVSIVSNGKDIITKQEIRILPGSSHDHIQQTAAGLARIDLTRDVRPMSQILENEMLPAFRSSASQVDVTVILISSCQRDDLISCAADLASRTGGLIWIAPLERDMERRVHDRRIRFFRVDH